MNEINGTQRRFNQSALTYDAHAPTQAQVAKSLASIIPPPAPSSILEIGCGTGLLTAELFKKFSHSKITITDMSPNMLQTTKAKFKTKKNLTFQPLNPEIEPFPATFDLIIASMVIHWFEDIPATLKKIQQQLKPGGSFYYSTIGQNCFPEWQTALKANNLPLGLRIPPALDSVFKEEIKPVTYPSAQKFLETLSQTGAHRPRQNYRPMSPKQLKSAMKYLEQQPETILTWHIQYGKLTSSQTGGQPKKTTQKN